VGHAGADSGGGDDDEDGHGNRSITLLGARVQGPGVRVGRRIISLFWVKPNFS
jgi:hypothetical protein